MEMDQNQTPRVNEECDRISSLHDSIVHHILSFLPPKEVVQTCILSKRWRELWKFHPYLYFEENNNNYKKKESFINFVNNFLHCRNKSSTIGFGLSCNYAQKHESHINAWIAAAVSAGVQDLQLILKTRKWEIDNLPSSLFTCNSLVELKLQPIFTVRFPESFCLPRLKRMHLRGSVFSKNFSHNLLESPSLEELTLLNCQIDVNFTRGSHALDADDNPLGTFSKLNKAIIGLRCSYGRRNRIENRRIGGVCLRKFIRKLSNVKILHLTFSCIKLLQTKEDLLEDLPTFCNLNQLTLGFVCQARKYGVKVMACLLQRSPVLQFLSIEYFNLRDLKAMLQSLSRFLPLPPSFRRIIIYSRQKTHIEAGRIFIEGEDSKNNIIVQLNKPETMYFVRRLRIRSTERVKVFIGDTPLTK